MQYSFQEKLEELVLTSLDTAQAMLKEYELVIPFGIRVFRDSDEKKINCPADRFPDDSWEQQIERVIQELKEYVKNENILATALVTSLQNGDQKGIGLQIENEQGSALFIYPCKKEQEKWLIDEPLQSEPLFSCVYENE